MRKSAFITFVTLIACGSNAEWDEYASFMASNLNCQVWYGNVKTNYSCCVSDWNMPSLCLPFNVFSNSVQNCSPSNELFGFSAWYDTNDVEMLYIGYNVCSNVISAHDSVIDRFSLMTTPVLHERTINNIGDACFTYPAATGSFSTVTFTRNNIMVFVSSHVTEVHATNIAIQIDSDILMRSTAP